MTKYVAIVVGQSGHGSGVKATRADVEQWAKNTLENSKANSVTIFEAVAVMSVAPREVVLTEIERPTEENTKPSIATETLKEVPKLNGHNPPPDLYID